MYSKWLMLWETNLFYCQLFLNRDNRIHFQKYSQKYLLRAVESVQLKDNGPQQASCYPFSVVKTRSSIGKPMSCRELIVIKLLDTVKEWLYFFLLRKVIMYVNYNVGLAICSAIEFTNESATSYYFNVFFSWQKLMVRQSLFDLRQTQILYLQRFDFISVIFKWRDYALLYK